MRAEMEGRYDDAADMLRAAQVVGELSGDMPLTTSAVALDIAVARDQLRLEAACALATGIGVVPALAPSVEAFLIGIQAARGEEVAVSRLDACVDSLGDRAENWFWLAGIAEAAVGAYYLRASDASRRLYELVRPYADRQLVVTVNPHAALGPAQLYAAMCALTLGQIDEAIERLEAAATQSEQLGATPWLLRSLALQIRTLQEHRATDGRLAPALARASDIAASLPDCFTVDEFRGLVGIARRPRAKPHALTQRELGVLKLAADGMSNLDIATQLHLSVKTVERHLTNCYVKLGVRNRAEATARFVRDQLA
jgi:DNA-binding NarL/FixJ family response regulator